MSTSLVDFLELKSLHQAELEGMIAIYRDAIEPSEQKTSDEIRTMVRDPRYILLVSRSDDTVNGFAIMFFPPGVDFWLLEYMAVAAPARSQSLGQAIFHESYRRSLVREPSAIMVLEVDQPGSSMNPTNDTKSRFRFYRRMECRMISGLDYILPLETTHAPPPMLLLTYRLPSLATVAKTRVASWLTSLYVDVYGKSAADPRIARMLDPLRDSIPLLPL